MKSVPKEPILDLPMMMMMSFVVKKLIVVCCVLCVGVVKCLRVGESNL